MGVEIPSSPANLYHWNVCVYGSWGVLLDDCKMKCKRTGLFGLLLGRTPLTLMEESGVSLPVKSQSDQEEKRNRCSTLLAARSVMETPPLQMARGCSAREAQPSGAAQTPARMCSSCPRAEGMVRPSDGGRPMETIRDQTDVQCKARHLCH